jgi:phosphoribosylformylglycinamidine (FGAM) synthase PurS component
MVFLKGKLKTAVRRPEGQQVLKVKLKTAVRRPEGQQVLKADRQM